MTGTAQPDRGSVPSILRPGAPANYIDIADAENVWDESATGIDSNEANGVLRIPSVLRPGAHRREETEDKTEEASVRRLAEYQRFCDQAMGRCDQRRIHSRGNQLAKIENMGGKKAPRPRQHGLVHTRATAADHVLLAAEP